MKIDRLLSIVIYLLNRELVSARALAERFNVSQRTIQRDMEALDMAGIPIVSIQGPRGGYGIMDGYTMDKQLVSRDDLFHIVTSLKGLSSTFGEMDGTLEKVEAMLPEGPDPFGGRSERLSMDFSMIGGDPSRQGAFPVVHRAVESGRLLEFSYVNNRLIPSKRVVEPMTIVFRWRSWYLYAFCLERQDFRLFRISRIREAVVLTKAFSRREGSFEDFIAQNDPYGDKDAVDLVLRYRAEMRPFVEEQFALTETEEDDDGRMIVRTTMPDEEWLAGYVLSWGSFVEVLEPQRIREKVASMAQQVVDVYN